MSAAAAELPSSAATTGIRPEKGWLKTMSDSMQTFCFKLHKQEGKVKKTALKARFSNGRQALERTIWHDRETCEWIVMLNGQAWIFAPYDYPGSQDKANPNVVYGHI